MSMTLRNQGRTAKNLYHLLRTSSVFAVGTIQNFTFFSVEEPLPAPFL